MAPLKKAQKKLIKMLFIVYFLYWLFLAKRFHHTKKTTVLQFCFSQFLLFRYITLFISLLSSASFLILKTLSHVELYPQA